MKVFSKYRNLNVALSYSSDQQLVAWHIGRALQTRQIQFFDYQIDPETNVGSPLLTKLYSIYRDQSQLIIGLFSEEYFKRKATLTEFDTIKERIRQHEIILIPVVIGDIDIKKYDTMIGELVYIKWSSTNPGSSCSQIVSSVDKLSPRPRIGFKISLTATVFSILLFFLFKFYPTSPFQSLDDPFQPGKTSNGVPNEPSTRGDDDISDKQTLDLCNADWEEIKAQFDTLNSLNEAYQFYSALNACLRGQDFENGPVYFAIKARPSSKEVKLCKQEYPSSPEERKECLREKAENRIIISKAGIAFNHSGVEADGVKLITDDDGISTASNTITADYTVKSAEPYGLYNEPYDDNGVPVFVILYRRIENHE